MKYFVVVLLGGSLLALDVSAQTQVDKAPVRGEASASPRAGGVAATGKGARAVEVTETTSASSTATAVAVGAMTAKWIAAAVGKGEGAERK